MFGRSQKGGPTLKSPWPQIHGIICPEAPNLSGSPKFGTGRGKNAWNRAIHNCDSTPAHHLDIVTLTGYNDRVKTVGTCQFMDCHRLFRKISMSIAATATMLGPIIAQAQGLQLLRDAEIEKFLEDYSHPIFEVAGINPDSIEILLVNDQTLNAFAGGRYMGVNTGLLTIADTPNQIEGVIAHEAGHLAGNHSARTQDAISAASRPLLLSLVLAAGAVAAGAPQAGIGLLGLGQTIGTANFLKYSRGQESTADQSGIRYLDALGKSGKGSLELWAKVRNPQIVRNREINPYLLTHPLANARLTALRTNAEASEFFEVEDSPEELQRLKMIQSKIRGFVEDKRFVLIDFPVTDLSDEARYARAVAYYRASELDDALMEINTLIGAHPENPYFHELKGQMLFEHGRVKEAIAPHARSVELSGDTPLLRINLGRALIATEEPENVKLAIAEIKRALLIETDNSFGWFELARAHSLTGNEPMANLATAESKYHANRKGEANAFARRALAGLKRGTPEWRQAVDVVRATQPNNGTPTALPSPKERDDKKEEKPEDTTENKKPDVPDPVLN